MALLKPPFLVDHPIKSGLIWAALYVPVIVMLSALQGRTENLLILTALAIPGGLAWGYFMRWWYRRKLGDAG